MRRNQLVWGVFLLVIGLLMLANAMGIKLPNGTSILELLWPLLLILGGIGVLAGLVFRGHVQVENAAIELGSATSAAVKISHGAGELKIHSGAGVHEVAHGSFAGGLNQKVSQNGDRLEVRMRPASDLTEFPFFGPSVQLDWEVALNAEIPIALKLSLGANKSELDLHDLNITDLDVETAASDTKMILPAGGRFRADLDVGAASLQIVVPEGLAARIHASMGIAELKIDQTRFPRSGSYYQSAGYDTAANAVDLTIDAGAASIQVN